jgi:hypothetical protein
LYSFTASIPENTSVTYKFLNGNDWLYTELVPFECGISDGFGGYNRNIVTDNVDFELPYVCFSSCADCEANIKEDETSKLSIYPNPNNGEFTLVGLKGNQTVYIFNSSGQLIKFINSNGRSTLNIDLSEFEAGLYQIVTGGITSSTVLITK